MSTPTRCSKCNGSANIVPSDTQDKVCQDCAQPRACFWCADDENLVQSDIDQYTCEECILEFKENREFAKKRKFKETKETKRYNKKMKDLGLEPIEVREFDVVKVDSRGKFVGDYKRQNEKFEALFTEMKDFLIENMGSVGDLIMDPEWLDDKDREALFFQIKGIIVRAANIASNGP